MSAWIWPLVCLTLLSLGLVMQVVLQRTWAPHFNWPTTVLHAAVVWGVFIWATTELLSVVKALTAPALLLAWGLWLISVVGLSITRRALWQQQARQLLESLKQLTKLSLVAKLLGLVVIGYLGIIGVTALLAAPNNWDSLVYHLSRVMHWQQNQSLAFYPTHVLRQLHSNPWAEYALLHLQLLSGGDRLANLVQFGAMLGSLIAIWQLVQQLGGNRRAQSIALAMAATLPMGILQATSTQNDYVAGFWLVCFVVFGLRTLKEFSAINSLFTGASLGLALLTKATNYLFAVPFCIWFGLAFIGKLKWQALKPALLIGGSVLLINAGQYVRNTALYGSPLGPDRENNNVLYKYSNDEISAGALISNVSRNLALEVGLPSPLLPVNDAVQTAITDLHQQLGLDLYDPRITWGGSTLTVQFSRDENLAGSPIQLALAAIALGILIVKRAKHPDPALILGLCLLSSFLLFCLVLRWQTWNSRLHLPLFLLAVTLIGLVAETYTPRWLATVFVLVGLGWAMPFVFRNFTRPLTGPHSILHQDRVSQLFFSLPNLQEPYTAAIHLIGENHCAQVGWLSDADDAWEYPVWVIAARLGYPMRLEAVMVHNVSNTLPPTITPCALMAVDQHPQPAQDWDGIHFVNVLKDGPVTVYLPQAEAP